MRHLELEGRLEKFIPFSKTGTWEPHSSEEDHGYSAWALSFCPQCLSWTPQPLTMSFIPMGTFPEKASVLTTKQLLNKIYPKVSWLALTTDELIALSARWFVIKPWDKRDLRLCPRWPRKFWEVGNWVQIFWVADKQLNENHIFSLQRGISSGCVFLSVQDWTFFSTSEYICDWYEATQNDLFPQISHVIILLPLTFYSFLPLQCEQFCFPHSVNDPFYFLCCPFYSSLLYMRTFASIHYNIIC